MEGKKMLNLAKKKPIKKKTTTRKKRTTTEKKKTTTPTMKAKKRVEELLQDVSLSPQKNEDKQKPQKKEGIEWLEEQVELLSNDRENLRKELAQSKDDYEKIFNENQRIKTNPSKSDSNNIELTVIRLFNKVQTNYHNIPNLVLEGRQFMLEMIKFFPFLKNERKRW